MHLAQIETYLGAAVREGIVGPGRADGSDGALAVFHDLDELRAGFRALRDAFPPGTLHAVAVKANPLAALLSEVASFGFGAECASLTELLHARDLGFPPSRILFDSPAKTRAEIATALGLGVVLNIDNLQELARVAGAWTGSGSRVGLRINPQVGEGSIASTSTAAATSKFGIALDEHRAAILEAYAKYTWLRGVHVHVGSQGCSVDLLVAGVRRAMELVAELRKRRCEIELVDIGGGLSVDYGDGDALPDFHAYVARLRQAVPELFVSGVRIATEFGRAVYAKSGWVATRVEYTKSAGGRRIAVTHAGADLFVRTAYVPDKWPHRITVHGPDGVAKTGTIGPWDVAGPLCFSGDLLARGRPLPFIEPGDFIVVHDAGAYTMSMWSRYNSRTMPAVHGCEAGALRLLKKAETPEDAMRFWR